MGSVRQSTIAFNLETGLIFVWGREEFAKQGMDLANVSMYAATEVIEKSLLEKTKPPNNLDEDEIQKVGLFRGLSRGV